MNNTTIIIGVLIGKLENKLITKEEFCENFNNLIFTKIKNEKKRNEIKKEMLNFNDVEYILNNINRLENLLN